MKAAYYQEYARLERENWWFLARKKIIQDQVERLFEKRKELKILNVGAAMGASSEMLAEFGQVTSVEYDQYCCDFASRELGLNFIKGSITELPFQNNDFDLVCAFDVVEHVQKDELAISELHRVCKPGGYTFTTVPAFHFLWSQHDVVNEHVKRYTMKRFLALFKKEGCTVYFKSYFNWWLFAPIALVRIFSRWYKKNESQARSDFGRVKNKFIAGILYRVFRSETYLLRNKISFPVGVSILVITKKNNTGV